MEVNKILLVAVLSLPIFAIAESVVPVIPVVKASKAASLSETFS